MISKKQEKLDEIKWYLGNQLGCDPCGTFKYCDKCNKAEENPCEKALERYQKSISKKKTQNKRKIGNTDFRATVVEEK